MNLATASFSSLLGHLHIVKIPLTAGCYSGVDVNVLTIGVVICWSESALGWVTCTMTSRPIKIFACIASRMYSFAILSRRRRLAFSWKKECMPSSAGAIQALEVAAEADIYELKYDYEYVVSRIVKASAASASSKNFLPVLLLRLLLASFHCLQRVFSSVVP
jgi:hypothetical protein